MGKRYFTDYVNHCLRFYSKFPNVDDFESELDKQNWMACEEAFRGYKKADKEMLLAIYSVDDTKEKLVKATADLYNLDKQTVWNKVNNIEYRVAKFRGLI